MPVQVQWFRNLKDVGDDEGTYKDRGAGWLLLNCTDVLKSDDEKLSSINKKLWDECKDQKTSLVAKKEDHISYSEVSDTVQQ